MRRPNPWPVWVRSCEDFGCRDFIILETTVKHFVLLISGALLASQAGAQVLGTGTITDQFTAGSRSLYPGTTSYSNPPYTDITGTIEYIPTYTDNDPDETKVWDLTVQNTTNDGSGGSSPAIPSNAGDPFSASPTMGIIVSDGGGGDNLEFGTTTSLNYTLKAAVYCAQRTLADGWERTNVTIRVPLSLYDEGRNVDAIGGYSLNFESDSGKVQAVKWNPQYPTLLTASQSSTREAQYRTVLAEQTVSTGWHIFELTAVGDRIVFEVDGNLIADIDDTLFPNGKAALGYREVFGSNANEHGGRFDYMTCTAPKSLPARPTAVKDWMMYE